MIAALPGTRGDYRVTVADHSEASLAGIRQNRDVRVQTLGATALSELPSPNEQSLSDMPRRCAGLPRVF